MRKLVVIMSLILMGCSNPVRSDWRGVHISEPSHISEIAGFSNAFSYVPQSLNDLLDVLAENDGRLMPVIELARYFFDAESGIYKWRDISDLKAAIGSNRIIILLDEPFWHIRKACQSGKSAACQEIESGYHGANSIFYKLKYELGYQVAHIEAYAELNLQKKSWPNDKVYLVQAADYVGFDCYGQFDNCGGRSQWEYGVWIYEAIQGTGKRMCLIPGAFVFYGVIDQLDRYSTIYHSYPEIFGCIMAFTWDDFDGFTGARNNEIIRNKLIDALTGE